MGSTLSWRGHTLVRPLRAHGKEHVAIKLALDGRVGLELHVRRGPSLYQSAVVYRVPGDFSVRTYGEGATAPAALDAGVSAMRVALEAAQVGSVAGVFEWSKSPVQLLDSLDSAVSLE